MINKLHKQLEWVIIQEVKKNATYVDSKHSLKIVTYQWKEFFNKDTTI